MNHFIIESYEDYEDLCSYIEKDKPDIVEIGDTYFITDKEQFNVVEDFKWLLEDITHYALNGLDKSVSIDMSTQPPLTQEDIQRDYTLLTAKGRIIEKPQVSETELDLKPNSYLEIENIKWGIFK